MQEWQPREASPRPRSRAGAEKSYHTPEGRSSGQEELPHLQGAAAAGHKRAERSYHTPEVRGSGLEKLVQGKEQQLHFAGAAVKRYPTSELRETQVRR